MRAEELFEIIGADFYTGVPDSQLRALCDLLMDRWGIDGRHHIIAANEGNCAALAAGYHLSSGRVPVVYMQNSGQGNVINPAASLLSDKVYGIPMLFIIGWRGEPGVRDEPQHIYQGMVTLELLKVMGISAFVIGQDTGPAEVKMAMESFKEQFAQGRQAAFVIRKGGLTYSSRREYKNPFPMTREEVIRKITLFSGGDPVVSTTGKASRELFEIRESNGQDHGFDLLTVGSMGHCSSIALGIALDRPQCRVWCIDGDGAMLMHMGSMAVIGSQRPGNLIHILINNCAHETVGGMPTAAGGVDAAAIAAACGYGYTASVTEEQELDRELNSIRDRKGPVFLEIKCGIGSRKDLGRPTTTAIENKKAFMEHLKGL